MHRRLASLALVVLAGCSGALSGDAAIPDDAPSDASIPDDAPDGSAVHDGATRPDVPPVDDDAGAAESGADAAATPDAKPPQTKSATNPVLGLDHPDPHVIRTIAADGKPIYHLVATVGDAGDLPVWSSRDLLTWTELPQKLFRRGSTPGGSIALNGKHHCSIWAPEIVQLGPASFMLHFTARRFASAQASCPAYAEDSGVYLAWSSSPTGPFAIADKPWEPLPAGGQISSCALRDQLPRSLDLASPGCQGTFCHHVMRLDSNVFEDAGRWWLAYAWYTNSPPKVDWEKTNLGEHVNLVELDAKDPFAVKCSTSVPQIPLANPHDAATKAKLAASCPRCSEMLSFTRGRQDEEMKRAGWSWGVVEAPSLFRRGEWVYALLSHSAWDSAYYSVYWVAAKSVEGLSKDDPSRLAGRFLVPSKGQSFGHGAPVLGPDGESWFYVHHRLDHGKCKASGDCRRDVWVSPIEFDDKADGRGDVWIRARFPAESKGVSVIVP